MEVQGFRPHNFAVTAYGCEASTLNEILNELTKPIWWFSVVIAGMAINPLSAYTKPVLDKSFLTTFAWWRRRSEERQKAWDERIEYIRSSKVAREGEIQSEFRLYFDSIRALLTAILIIVATSFFQETMSSTTMVFVFSVSAWFWFNSSRLYFEAMKTRYAVPFADVETSEIERLRAQ